MIVNAVCRKNESVCEIQKSGNDPFGCKIYTLYNAYGFDFSFAEFWLQRDAHDNVTAIISRYYGAYTVCLKSGADVDEIICFLNLQNNLINVSADGEFLNDRSLKIKGLSRNSGSIYKYANRIVSDIEYDIITPNLKQMYGLLKECEGKAFVVPDYESFILDVSHKIRHGLSEVYGVKKGNALVGCAMTVAQSENTAVIGAVVVSPEFRKKHIGKALVSFAAEKMYLQKKCAYVFVNTKDNENFYISCGFKKVGIWAEYG